MNDNRGLVLFARRVLSSVRYHSVSSSRRFSSPPNQDPPPASGPLSNKLFVAGLSWAADEKTLKEAFSAFGDVTEVRIMYDKDTGRSRGFGFVYFSKEDDAKSARDAMDGKII
uniref:RRM domain-containing protein n=1 Tax=Kalanchoe fedtschenkoi TaxID=63787 RepID=A0A7N0RIX8_KALFE